MRKNPRARNLSKTYTPSAVEVQALRDVTFDVQAGAFVAFIGPSGSGKTTLLNLIGCLDRPTSGSLLITGQDVTTLDRRAAAMFRGSHLGFVFQDFNLIPVLTVYENVEYPLQLVQPTPTAERRARVLDLLEAVGMSNQRDKYPDEISGGQKQRVSVARALVTRPQLVLADEPTANLDHSTAALVIDTMKRLRDSRGTTFVFSTHDPRVVREVDLVYRLEDGQLVDRATKGTDQPWAS
jgi:putative ABC transport system ATP-binding protein